MDIDEIDGSTAVEVGPGPGVGLRSSDWPGRVGRPDQCRGGVDEIDSGWFGNAGGKIYLGEDLPGEDIFPSLPAFDQALHPLHPHGLRGGAFLEQFSRGFDGSTIGLVERIGFPRGITAPGVPVKPAREDRQDIDPIRLGFVKDLVPFNSPALIHFTSFGISHAQTVELNAGEFAAASPAPIQESLIVDELVPGDIPGKNEAGLPIHAEIEIARFERKRWE